MNSWKKFAVAAALVTLSGAVLAASSGATKGTANTKGSLTGTTMDAGTAVTKESVEKSALEVHPGTVEMAQKMHNNGKDIWEVKVKGSDGKQYVINFDAKTGYELK